MIALSNVSTRTQKKISKSEERVEDNGNRERGKQFEKEH
jgi:hypothetical protein